MKSFLLKTAGLSLIFLTIIVVLLTIFSSYRKGKGFANYTTESNTLWLSSDKNYDLLFMGVSHARNFSRHKNHLRMEEILNASIANIGQGSAICGANEQLFYLDYFYHKQNKASKIVYILSPTLLFSENLPMASNTFRNEIFEFSFFWRYLNFKSENKNARIMSYLQSNLHPYSLITNPHTEEAMLKKMDSLNLEKVQEGQNIAFNGPELNYKQFNSSIAIINETIELAEQNGSELVLVIPPALFGKWKGHEQLLAFAQFMEEKHSNVQVFDGSETVLNPEFYYDSHHLNTAGIVYFSENYLKPLLD